MENKKAIIYCYSGTGNTYIAAKKTAEALAAYNIDATIFRVRITDSAQRKDGTSNSSVLLQKSETSEKNNKNVPKYNFTGFPDPNDFDIALFSYPIYAFNTPWFFLKFIKCLPVLNESRKNMPAYIFKTSGEPFSPNNSSSYSLVRRLKKKGFMPCSDIHMLMPYNLMFRYPDSMVKQMYLHTESMAKKLAEKIAKNQQDILKYNPFGIIFSCCLRLQQFGALINGPLHRVDAESCISCGKCIELCPASNIKFVEKSYKNECGEIIKKQIPRMSSKCQMCMACTLNCPKASINPGFLTPWKINPEFNFDRILNDESIPSNWTDSPDAKYFKLFRKYYKKNPLV